jgi:hemerythrin-like metal-binding protein
MSDMEWRNELLLGIPAVDLQHQRIFDCFVTIAREGITKHESWLADPSFVQLIKFLQEHFALEESMMRKFGYPELERHIDEHRAFQAELYAVAQKSIGTEGSVSQVMIRIFERWQRKHIMTSDRHYVEYLLGPARKSA